MPFPFIFSSLIVILARGIEEKVLPEWDECRAHANVHTTFAWHILTHHAECSGSSMCSYAKSWFVFKMILATSFQHLRTLWNIFMTLFASMKHIIISIMYLKYMHLIIRQDIYSHHTLLSLYSCLMCRHQGRDLLAHRNQSVCRCAWRLAAPSPIERARCFALCCCWTWAAAFCKAHKSFAPEVWHGIVTNLYSYYKSNPQNVAEGKIDKLTHFLWMDWNYTNKHTTKKEVKCGHMLLYYQPSPEILSQPGKMCLFSCFFVLTTHFASFC